MQELWDEESSCVFACLREGGEFFAEPVRVTGSGVLTTMTKANGYVIIPENREGVEEGESVRVQLFSSIMRGIACSVNFSLLMKPNSFSNRLFLLNLLE